MVADGSGKQRTRPEWLQQYELVGKIGEGTYGLVYLAKSKEPAHRWVYRSWARFGFRAREEAEERARVRFSDELCDFHPSFRVLMCFGRLGHC